MKTLLVFLLGAAVGAFALSYYQQNQSNIASAPTTASAESLAERARSTGDRALSKTKEVAENVRDSVSEKLADWHLTSDEIKADLAKTGEVVRSKSRAAGEAISDARVIAVIKAKYVLDRELSALEIKVDCRDGEVTLRGTVASAAILGKAVAVALDTDGVHHVVSKLGVKS